MDRCATGPGTGSVNDWEGLASWLERARTRDYGTHARHAHDSSSSEVAK